MAVRDALVRGQQAADQAYLATYHRTGRLIHGHLLAQQARAGYGARLVPRLAAALQTDERLLYRCLRFFRAYPKLASRPELAWTHYRVLLDVTDQAGREALEKDTCRHGWTVQELESRVRAFNAINVTPTPDRSAPPASLRRLVPRRGTPGICRIVDASAGPVADLGFACYRDLPARSPLAAGDFARITADTLAPAPDATKADLFTYRAGVIRVVDGDTLWVRVDLEPGRWVKQKLRLRDLDCPELSTPAGKAAKRFTEGFVAGAAALTICTTKPDKYDRYLADVFVDRAGGGEAYLNNALLESGHAVVKREWEFADWGE